MNLENRTIIVTGAGGGVGRAIALLLGAEGANVVVNDYGGSTDGEAGTADRAQAVAAEVIAAGGQAIANRDAVGSRAAAENIRDCAMGAYGRIDGLINNAGIMIAGKVDELSDEQVDRIIEINYLGAFRLIRAVWPIMRQHGYGRVVNVSSNSAFGYGNLAAYGSSKSALMGLTTDLGQEGLPLNIRVNSILPVSYSRLTARAAESHQSEQAESFSGWLQQHFPPAKIAALVAYLVSPQCDRTGQHFTVGGGRFAMIETCVRAGYYDPDLNFARVADQMAITDASKEGFLQSAVDDLINYGRFSPIPSPPLS